MVFWSLSCYKELKLATNRFAGRTLRGLLFQMQNISLRSSGMRRKQNFEIFEFKSDTAVLTFTFRFLSFPFFSLFLPHVFFSLAGHLVGFVLVGRVFWKAFRILGLGEQWSKIFMEIFRLMSHGFLLLSPVSLTELCSFWYGLKDLFTLHKLVDKVVLDR